MNRGPIDAIAYHPIGIRRERSVFHRFNRNKICYHQCINGYWGCEEDR